MRLTETQLFVCADSVQQVKLSLTSHNFFAQGVCSNFVVDFDGRV